MALKQNVAEGGSHGDTITTGNSGGASGDAFNALTIGASATLTWSNARPAHGSMGIKLTNDSANPTHFYYTGYSATQMVARMVVELDTLPSAGMRLLDIRTGSVSVARVILNASNQPVFQTNNGGTTLKTFTGSTFSADTKYRIEVAATPGNAADATLKCDIYAGDSGSPIEAGYSSTTVTTGTTSNLTQVFFGSAAAIAWSGDAYFDDVACQDGTLTYLGVYTGASIPGHSASARAVFSAPTVTTETVIEGAPAAGRGGSNGATVSTAGSVVLALPAGSARAVTRPPSVSASSGVAGDNPFWYMPAVTVEVAFNAGYTTPAASRSWTDVSGYVELEDLISIARGREDEFGTTNANSLTLTLDNTDGRFTATRVASPYYPNVKIGRPIRVTVTPPGGTASVRFLGYIDTWPVAWDNTDVFAKATISATSRTARLGEGVELRSIVEEEILTDSPAIYCTMGEPEGATSANDSTGSSVGPLETTGTGAAVVFGSATGPGTDGLTAVTFAGGKYLAGSISTGIPTSVSLECFFSATSASDMRLAFVRNAGDTMFQFIYLQISSGIVTAAAQGVIGLSVSSAGTYNDGAVHHALLTVQDAGPIELFVDGVSQGTFGASSAFDMTDAFSLVTVGADSTGANRLTGSVSHVAFFTPSLSAGRATAHAAAGLTGFVNETPAARLTRYASYAGIDPAEIDAETGASTLTHIDTTGITAIDAMRKVESTEGGVLFDGKDGTLVFHGRGHRYDAVSEFTVYASLGQVGEGVQPTVDRSALRNDVTAALADGTVTARVKDDSSIGDYGLGRDSVELHTADVDAPYARATWLTNSYKEPSVRIGSLEVDVMGMVGSLYGSGLYGSGPYGANLPAFLAADIGSRFTVADMPSQAAETDTDYFVEGYTETIGVGTWTATLNVSPARVFEVFTLDDATLGQINGPYLIAH